MNVLMVGVDKKAVGGMWTVVENYLNDKKFCNDTNLIYIPTATSTSIVGKILFSGKGLIKVIFTLLSRRIDIVHVHMAERGSVFREGIVAILGKLFGSKVIIHMHGATFEEWYITKNCFIQQIISWILNKADKLLILGEFWNEFASGMMKDNCKIQVLHNAVNVPKKRKYNEKSTEIMFLGMLIRRKGIDDFLEAIKEIKGELPSDVRVKLYGSDKHSNIQEKIDGENIGNIVSYYGWLTNENREECFSRTMINVLPSYNEGLPMTILEAMAFGIPTISTNVAAIPEAICDREEGILINPGDVKALANAILSIVTDTEKRVKFSKNAYSRAIKEFDVEKHIEKLRLIYVDLIAKEEDDYEKNNY